MIIIKFFYLCQGTWIGGKNTVEAVGLGKCQSFSFDALNESHILGRSKQGAVCYHLMVPAVQ
jgi:hypothetical protein